MKKHSFNLAAVGIFLLLITLVGVLWAQAADDKSYPLVFHVDSMDSDQPLSPELAAKYPHARLLIINFKPVDHPAGKDGAQLGDGEGSWVDRGMRPSEPHQIRLLIPEDSMMVHTLRVSDGPFCFQVINTGHGYFRTVPFESPSLELP